MSPKFTPAERLQLTALLGALQSGGPGFAPTAFNIFSGIQDDVTQRRADQREQKHYMLEQALQQRQLEEAQQAQQLQQALELQSAHGESIGDILKFVNDSMPTSQSTTTEKTNPDFGTDPNAPEFLTSTTTETTPGLSYDQLMSQVGALAGNVPGGLTQQESQSLSGLTSAEFGPQVQAFLDAAKEGAVTSFAKGETFEQVMSRAKAAAEAQGFSQYPEIMGQIAAQIPIAQMEATVGQTQAEQGGATPSLIDRLTNVAGVGGAIAGGVKGASLLRRMVGPEPGLGLEKQIAEFGGKFPGIGNRVLPEAPAAPVEEGLIMGSFKPAPGEAQMAGRLAARGISPGGWAADEALNPAAFGRTAGRSLAAEGAVGAAGGILGLIPLGLQMGEDYDTKVQAAQWQSLSQEQKRIAYAQAITEGTLDPSKDGFDWNTGTVLPDQKKYLG
jgi:hypothetical protein